MNYSNKISEEYRIRLVDECHDRLASGLKLGAVASMTIGAQTLLYLLERNDPEKKNLRDMLKASEAWMRRWGAHVGNCGGDISCTCGLTLVQSEAYRVLYESDETEHDFRAKDVWENRR